MSNISELNFDNKNFNKHTEYGMSLLEKSLRENGGGRSILLDKNNNIIAGNGIVEAAGNIGLEDVQIVESDGKKLIAVKRTDIDLDSKQGREMALADNATSASDLEWDEDAIKEEAEKWDIDSGSWLGNEWLTEQEETEEDEAPEVDESEPPKSQLGKVYKLSEHRLMCGDSTDAGPVAILMDGQKADMVFCDAPYGYKYESNHQNKYEMLKNDDKILDFIPVIWGAMKDNCPVYEFCGWQSLKQWLEYFENTSLDLKNVIIWKKNNWSMGDLKGAYAGQYEVILYLNKGRVELNGARDTVIWEFDREPPKMHPTMKPIELVAYALNKSSKKDDVVLDCFGGSGSTLIACEQLGRKCYMMELDPHYCDVIRKRWWKFTHDGDEDGWEEGTPAI